MRMSQLIYNDDRIYIYLHQTGMKDLEGVTICLLMHSHVVVGLIIPSLHEIKSATAVLIA
jgi:hypothetical protein